MKNRTAKPDRLTIFRKWLIRRQYRKQVKELNQRAYILIGSITSARAVGDIGTEQKAVDDLIQAYHQYIALAQFTNGTINRTL